MFTQAHAGITLGLAVLFSGVLSKAGYLTAKAEKTAGSSEPSPQSNIDHDHPTGNRVSWFTVAANYVQLRFMLLSNTARLSNLFQNSIQMLIFLNLHPAIF